MRNYRPHSGDEILVCDECGALVDFSSRDKHEDWHAWLVTFDELDHRLRNRRRWVVAEHQ